MANTGTWTIPNLVVGTEYIMPDGYWVVPANASNFTINWSGRKADGTLDGTHTVSVTLINRDITAGIDRSTLPLGPGVDTGTFTSANSHNGTNIFTGAFKITAAPSGLPDHCLLQLTAYTGTAHPVEFVWRSGAWHAVDGTLDFVWRGGAWAAVPEEQVWRSGAWKQV